MLENQRIFHMLSFAFRKAPFIHPQTSSGKYVVSSADSFSKVNRPAISELPEFKVRRGASIDA